MPALGDARVVETWAGLRPWTADGAPILGATSVEGLLVATGHHRNGILLAPATARALADLALGAPPSLDLAPFSASRFT
jgi:glycine oxidase